jgi:hypothetical protein
MNPTVSYQKFVTPCVRLSVNNTLFIIIGSVKNLVLGLHVFLTSNQNMYYMRASLLIRSCFDHITPKSQVLEKRCLNLASENVLIWPPDSRKYPTRLLFALFSCNHLAFIFTVGRRVFSNSITINGAKIF